MGFNSGFKGLNRCIEQRVCAVCIRVNYKEVPVTSVNKYFHYGISGTE